MLILYTDRTIKTKDPIQRYTYTWRDYHPHRKNVQDPPIPPWGLIPIPAAYFEVSFAQVKVDRKPVGVIHDISVS